MPGQHAFLSASGAARWMNCTPSAKAEAGMPREDSTPYAAEGTLAHAWGEYLLKTSIVYKRQAVADYKKQDVKPPEEPMNGEMLDAVTAYSDAVLEAVNDYETRDLHPYLMVEQRLDFSPWVPAGWGTGDAVIIYDNGIHVLDLKYGKGVLVRAAENPQLRLYGLGAYYTFAGIYDISTVKTSIIQPRLGHIETEEIRVKNLKAWGDEVHAKALTAWSGGGERKAGEWCRFCRCRETCKALKTYLLDPVTGKAANTLTDEEVATIVLKSADIKKYLADVETYALARAIDGKAWPGLKVVEGRSVRKITDEEKATAALLDNGVTDIYKPQALKGITDLTKMLSKNKFAEIVGPFVNKPAGKPILVSADDKRKPYTPTYDFDDKLINN